MMSHPFAQPRLPLLLGVSQRLLQRTVDLPTQVNLRHALSPEGWLPPRRQGPMHGGLAASAVLPGEAVVTGTDLTADRLRTRRA